MRYAWIEELQRAYAKRFGAEPLNISHWNVASGTERSLRPLLHLPTRWWGVNYVTAIPASVAHGVAAKLDVPITDRCLTFTPSSSDAIECVLIAAKRSGVRQLAIAAPFYFAVKVIAEEIGLRVRVVPMPRDTERYSLPEWIESDDAVWLTNPIYSTGIHFGADLTRAVRQLLREKRRLVILDEALAQPGKNIAGAIGTAANLITIHSPHKAVAINTYKFSLIAAPPAYAEVLHEVADIAFGGLPASAVAAVHHFISPAFDRYDRAFRKRTDEAREAVRSLSVPGLQWDFDSSGHFMTCWFSDLSAELGLDRRFMWARVKESAAIAIPALQDSFDGGLGFAFRLNLALDSRPFRAATRRWLLSLSRALLAARRA